MKKLLCLLICLIQFIGFGQEIKHLISAELGYGVHSYSMDKFNRYYLDSFAFKTNPKIVEDKITSGQNFNLSLKYAPNGLFDVGLYGNYQFGKTSNSSTVTLTDVFGNPISNQATQFEFRTEALCIGVSTTLFVSHLLNLQEKESKFLKHFHFGVEFNGGIGFSSAIGDFRIENQSFASMNYKFQSRDFQGQVGVK